MNRDEVEVAGKARAAFEHAVREIPVATANRLRLARRNALAHGAGRAASPRAARWGVPLAAAAALVLGLGWWQQSVAPDSAPVVARAARTPAAPVVPVVPSLPMLANDDEADLYDWLAEAPVATDARGDGAL